MPLCVPSQLPLNGTKSLLLQFDCKGKNLDIVSLIVGTVKSLCNLVLKKGLKWVLHRIDRENVTWFLITYVYLNERKGKEKNALKKLWYCCLPIYNGL
jgi:hypothetical protein